MTAQATTDTELPAPPDGFTAYGVTIHVIGDDGDALIAFGHLNKRRFFAACNHFARNELGWCNLADGYDTTWAVMKTEIAHMYGRYITNPEDPENDWEVWWGSEGDEEHPVPITVWEMR